MIRVLVAEDSDHTRALMIKILRHDRSIEVIGEARDGLEAIKMTRRFNPTRSRWISRCQGLMGSPPLNRS